MIEMKSFCLCHCINTFFISFKRSEMIKFVVFDVSINSVMNGCVMTKREYVTVIRVDRKML